jgi:hypothetical protein
MFCDAPFCDLPFASFVIEVGLTNGEIFYFDADINQSDSFILEIQQSTGLTFSLNLGESFVLDIQQSENFVLSLQQDSGFLQIR